MNIGKCSGCGRPIIWIVTTNGKKMPCNPGAHVAFKGPTGNNCEAFPKSLKMPWGNNSNTRNDEK